MTDTPEFDLTDAHFERIAAAMARSVDEDPTAEHVRLAIMITAATNEVFAIINEHLAVEKAEKAAETHPA